MRLYLSPNTCSMGEVGSLSQIEWMNINQGTAEATVVPRSRDLKEELGKVIAEARVAHRKFLVANLSQAQFNDKKLVAALRAKKFSVMGRYRGNNSPAVYVFARGLK